MVVMICHLCNRLQQKRADRPFQVCAGMQPRAATLFVVARISWRDSHESTGKLKWGISRSHFRFQDSNLMRPFGELFDKCFARLHFHASVDQIRVRCVNTSARPNECQLDDSHSRTSRRVFMSSGVNGATRQCGARAM